MHALCVSIAALIVASLLTTCHGTGISQVASPDTADPAYQALARGLDRFHVSFDVYTESDAAGNHFNARGKIGSPPGQDGLPPNEDSLPFDEQVVSPMDETWADQPHSGLTCVKATFRPKGRNFGGWYWLNGVLQGDAVAPGLNWGSYGGAGIDLRGATRLTFWARGASGGERVAFTAFGVGRDPDNDRPLRNIQFPDSSPRVTTGYVTLSTTWQEFAISLAQKDPRYVLGGFGWVTNAAQNKRQDITFFVDDIRYDKPRPTEPRFLVSYETIRSQEAFDVVMRNVAFTYDNAVALIAFLAAGDERRAGLIADALVYALNNDRYYGDRRLRNAYQGGDLILPPGWAPRGKAGTVRMPGWYQTTPPRNVSAETFKPQWLEDKFQVSTHTGNLAWAMLGLLGYEDAVNARGISAGARGPTCGPYCRAAVEIGEWIENNCRDARGAGGYTGGIEGWEPNPVKLTYKATEHNIDLFAVFDRLARMTGDKLWADRAAHAKRFVLAMWDANAGKFWTGTDEGGVNLNEKNVPVDVQAWAVLALGEEGKPYWKALDFAEANLVVREGYDFNQDRDGVWYEGTAQMALAFRATGQLAKADRLVQFLWSSQLRSGALPAADRDGLTTGFTLPDGDPWLYFRRAHVGATAWLVLAERGVNPFWMAGR